MGNPEKGMGKETVNEANEKRKPIRSFGDKKVESENMKSYSIVAIGYPAEDADLEAVDRFDASRIHYNKY